MINSKRFVLPSLVFAVLLCSRVAIGTTYIVFRYDDLAADRFGERENSSERREIWEAEQAVDGLFDKFGFPYVVAIIPERNGVSFADDIEKVEFIKHAIQEGRVEVAQHGFNHINHAKKNHRRGEFRERSYEDQFNDIVRGKNILCECLGLTNIETFVPPFNGWDNNTAKVMKKLGFSILSADRSYYHKAVTGLTVIPFTAQLWELESKVNEKELPNDAVIIVLFHPTQIVNTKGSENRFFGIERFEKLLHNLSTMQSTKIVTLQQLADECSDLTIDRYREANNLHRQRSFWSKLIPQRSSPGETSWRLYSSTQVYDSQATHWRVLTVAIMTGLVFGGLIVRYIIRLVMSAKWCFCIDVIAGMMFFLAVLKEIHIVYKGYQITGIPVITAVFSASFLIPLISGLIKKPQNGNARVCG